MNHTNDLSGYYTEEEVSQTTGKAISTLRSDAARRKGPPRTVINRKIYYRIEAFQEWLLAQERNFEAQCEKPTGSPPRCPIEGEPPAWLVRGGRENPKTGGQTVSQDGRLSEGSTSTVKGDKRK